MALTNDYYIYALLDPRVNPQLPFYIGKGQGARMHDHIQRPDSTAKWARIREIQEAGLQPLEAKLIDNLTEDEAFKNEALMISYYGVQSDGGALTNSVAPKGKPRNGRDHVKLPFGVAAQASSGLDLLKSSIHQLIRSNPDGLTNADVASVLGLRSHNQGVQKDYLSWSVLGLLVDQGVIRKEGTKYFANN